MFFPPRIRFILIACAGLSLLAAFWSGLVRLGWNLPSWTSGFPAHHGPLMMVGFLGTLIGLERAVALERRWPYGAPISTALAALALLVGWPPHAGQALSVLGSVFLLLIFISLYRQHASDSMATMGVGAVLWLVANSLWYSGYPLSRVAPWWVGFLVLTIAGERLELSRMLRLSGWDRLKFLLGSGIFLSGLFVSLPAFDLGVWLSGIGLVALAFWLLRYDIAWRTGRQKGLPRFMAICLLTGYLWLGIGGLLWIGFPDLFIAGPSYDAALHAIFLGFVLSMIFGHAPIIFPSITGVAMPFRRTFYGHLALLHASLLLRLEGDLAPWPPGQRWGGALNALAILFFLLNHIRAVRSGRSGAA